MVNILEKENCTFELDDMFYSERGYPDIRRVINSKTNR